MNLASLNAGRRQDAQPLGRKAPGRWVPGRRAGFTLVELLVVIAIIAVLAGLLLAAAAGALGTANEARILAEMTQMTTALEDHNNLVGSYPPNAQTDLDGVGTNDPIDDNRALSNFRRHFSKAFPSHREPPALIDALLGRSTRTNSAQSGGATNLVNGMNAAESLVFWLGGFSDDPKYPISGSGGPSYSVTTASLNGATPAAADPIESRNWELEANLESLGPRDEAGYFDTASTRFITYADPRDDSLRRINFWYLKAPGTESPYVYFDTSRASSADSTNDVPAASRGATSFQYNGRDANALNQLFYVHAIKERKTDASASNPFRFANDGKFQLLHPGRDNAWGILPVVNSTGANERLVNSAQFNDSATSQDLLLLYPDGPWTLDLADTLAGFAGGTLEDAQP